MQATKELTIPSTGLLDRTRQSQATTVVHVGGARSSKSYSLAQYFISLLLGGKNLVLGVTRKTGPALKMSVVELLVKLLKEYRCYDETKHYKSAPMNYRYGSNVLWMFSMDEAEKLKSTSFNYIWMEEANEFDYEDYTVLKLRLSEPSKGRRNQIFLSLNPIDEANWIPQRLLKETDVEVIHSTYKDNPFLSSEYKKLLEDLINQDENYYRVYTLGEWGKLENLVYRNWQQVEAVPGNRQAMVYGLDFGLINPSTLIKVTLAENQIYLNECFYRPGMTNKDIIEALTHEERGDIYADPSALQMIEEIRRAGYNCIPAQKDVAMGINLCKRQKLNIAKASSNIIKEIRGYQHKKDAKGYLLDEPVKFNDHAMDAMRYGVYGLVERYGLLWQGDRKPLMTRPKWA